MIRLLLAACFVGTAPAAPIEPIDLTGLTLVPTIHGTVSGGSHTLTGTSIAATPSIPAPRVEHP